MTPCPCSTSPGWPSTWTSTTSPTTRRWRPRWTTTITTFSAASYLVHIFSHVLICNHFLYRNRKHSLPSLGHVSFLQRSKKGTEFFKIDEEMAEKNEAEDGSSISLKSPCHMKWYRQQNIPYFTCFLMSQKCKFCFLLYLKEIYAQFVETNVLVKHNIYHELKLTIMYLDLQITWKHPVLYLRYISW